MAGCAVNSDVEVSAVKHTTVAPSGVELLGSPEPTAMALYHEGSRPDRVRVGDTWASAKLVFPEPPRGGYDVRDLPSQFSDKFDAQGWETNKDEGFGAILSENKVVAAVYELDHQRNDVILPYINAQMKGLESLKAKRIDGAGAAYWFWHADHQTTMICRLETKNGINLTLAMGDDNVLKQLGMTDEDAQKQIDALKTPPGS